MQWAFCTPKQAANCKRGGITQVRHPMMKGGFFLALLAATSLLACGKPEEAPAPGASLPAAEVRQMGMGHMMVPEPVTPIVETPSAAPSAATLAAQPPAAASIAKPAEVKPAPIDKSVPVAQPGSEAVATSPQPDLAHGQQVYRQSCAFCHDKGVAGAPKIGDAAAWSPRLAQGMDALYASALRGKGAMPGKGGNPSLADDDVKAAVDYLSAQAR